jgi:acetyl esterase/lipase
MPGMELREEQRRALDVAECFAPGPPGAPDVRVVVYRPTARPEPLPLIVHFHGGAFCFLRPETFERLDARHAIGLGCVVASVDYRLAPAHPFPAAPEDCYHALSWAVDHLDIDRGRVAVMGGSAGGALAAAVTLMARDRGGPAICYQTLYVPVTDDRLRTESMRNHADYGRATGMWLHYLGEHYDRTATSPYAAPNRAGSLAGLPPAYIRVNGDDAWRDEGIEYAVRLMHAGVAVELSCVPDLSHDEEFAQPEVGARLWDHQHAALATALSRLPTRD